MTDIERRKKSKRGQAQNIKEVQITKIKNLKYLKYFHYLAAVIYLGHSIAQTCASGCAPSSYSPAAVVGTRAIMEWSYLLSWGWSYRGHYYTTTAIKLKELFPQTVKYQGRKNTMLQH